MTNTLRVVSLVLILAFVTSLIYLPFMSGWIPVMLAVALVFVALSIPRRESVQPDVETLNDFYSKAQTMGDLWKVTYTSVRESQGGLLTINLQRLHKPSETARLVLREHPQLAEFSGLKVGDLVNLNTHQSRVEGATSENVSSYLTIGGVIFSPK